MNLDGLDKDRLLVVGVSGGADSLALLHLLHEAGFRLLVCHYNHRLRPEADSDASFVWAAAGKLGLHFATESGDVAAFAAENGLSVEEAARKLRYRFLFKQARAHDAQAVAVGHTADDQVETVLMHFVRGAGLSGLKGMLPRTVLTEFNPEIPLVRPILGWWRADTEAYCREHGLGFLTDSSNADPAYLRNRLRLSLIPELERYNPRFKEALLRSSGALRGDFELISGLVDEAWNRTVIENEPGFVAFDRAMLKDLPLPLRRDLIRRAAYTLHPGLRDVDFDALERAAGLPATSVDIAGGLRLLTEGGWTYLAGPGADLPTRDWPQVTGDSSQVWEWAGKGQLELADGLVLKGEIREMTGEMGTIYERSTFGGLPDVDWGAEQGFSAWLATDLTGDSLRVRTPRPGDRIEPCGMPGKTVKLSDLFINHKIPKRLRARWPLVCAGEAIAWVPGLRVSERFVRRPGLRRRFWTIVVKREQRQN